MRTRRPMQWWQPSSLYFPLIACNDEPHSPGTLQDKLKVLLAKPTRMFRDSDVNGTGTSSLIGVLRNFLKHMDSDGALAMDRCRNRCDSSFCRFRFISQCRVGIDEFFPLNVTGPSRVGVGVDNTQEICWKWICSWLRRFYLIIWNS